MSEPHVDDRLAELSLGMLKQEEQDDVRAHVAKCAACARELRALADVVPSAIEPIEPSPQARARLLAAIAGPLRYQPFHGRVAHLFDISPEAAAEALERITDPGVWQPGPAPGMRVVPMRGGPALRGRAMFLRFEPLARCPRHRHLGEERFLILEGSLREDEGLELRAGDLAVKPAGSAHAFVVPAGDPCTAAYVIEGGVELAP